MENKCKGAYMNTGKGMYSTPDNPMKIASKVAPMAGPGVNSDQQKVNRLLKKALTERESLRGKSGI